MDSSNTTHTLCSWLNAALLDTCWWRTQTHLFLILRASSPSSSLVLYSGLLQRTRLQQRAGLWLCCCIFSLRQSLTCFIWNKTTFLHMNTFCYFAENDLWFPPVRRLVEQPEPSQLAPSSLQIKDKKSSRAHTNWPQTSSCSFTC